MKIKTLLNSSVILLLVTIFFIGDWVLSLSNEYDEMKDDAYIARELNNSIFQLNNLSSDYLLYYQFRASQQWKEIHSQLGQVLKEPEIYHVYEFIDLKILMDLHKRLLKLFERLEKARENVVQQQNNNVTLHQQQRKALAAQLLSNSQLMSQVATELSDAVEVKRIDIEKELFWLLVLIFFMFIFAVSISWGIIAYRVVLPLNQLKKYIANVGDGNINSENNFFHDDEVGEVADSFDNMAKSLFETTVSKDKLIEEVAERKKYEKELMEQQGLNSAILENAGNVIVMLDTEGNIVKFNHSAEKSTGFSRHELLGKHIWDFVIPKEEKEKVEYVFTALRQGNTAIAGNYENHWKTKNGEYRLFEWHNTILRNSANEITHVVAIGYDITEKRSNEIEKQRMQRELDQSHKMEALGKLTGGIAHDFNNMLGIILGYTELALGKSKNNDNGSTISNYLEQVVIASNRAKELIAKMLTFSRIDHAHSHAIKLSPLIDENIKLMQSMLPSTIKLEVIKEDFVTDIIMDPVQLQQVIMNLMINAKDAMDGVGTIKVSLSTFHSSDQECSSCHKKITGEWVEITILDNGKGMSDEVIERIFEPFFTTKGLGEGTGMGLSVIHGIVKGYNGHIIVESTLGKGSNFHLLFPKAVTENKIIDDEALSEPENIRGNGQRILIIDDQESLADIQYDLLTSYGYECTKKYNSAEALELYLSDTNAFDLIITDQTMPNLTGLELIDIIRNKELAIPIIMSTGYSEKIKDGNLEIKDVMLLKKPVEAKKLLKHIARIFKDKEV